MGAGSRFPPPAASDRPRRGGEGFACGPAPRLRRGVCLGGGPAPGGRVSVGPVLASVVLASVVLASVVLASVVLASVVFASVGLLGKGTPADDSSGTRR